MSPDSSAPRRLVIASHNPGKVREMAELVEPFGLELTSATELGLPEPVEDGKSFTENATIKAKAGAKAANMPVLADDSGLAVTALGGGPGIYSARWAGPDKDFAQAMQRVETALTGKTDRRAAFISVLCLGWPNGETQAFEGRVEGQLVWPPRGSQGFGYDPMFQPDGYELTFGELPPEQKHAISHRARAFQKLAAGVLARWDEAYREHLRS